MNNYFFQTFIVLLFPYVFYDKKRNKTFPIQIEIWNLFQKVQSLSSQYRSVFLSFYWFCNNFFVSQTINETLQAVYLLIGETRDVDNEKLKVVLKVTFILLILLISLCCIFNLSMFFTCTAERVVQAGRNNSEN